MRNFNWNEFKKGDVVVKCTTRRIAGEFLCECFERNLLWQGLENDALYGLEDDIYNKYKQHTCYRLDEDGLTFCGEAYYEKCGLKIIEWEIDKMEGKAYKIHEILNKEFLGKKFVDTICEDKYRVVNSFDDLYSLIDVTDGTDVADNMYLQDILETDFILMDEER